ncbi:hypothetical protein NBRC116601_02720 [Cognatishimia sp. WU-CL00825]|uniref:hypothetical protein n=1 Tax=Cognatishimia sp. WU-CL00825 TaxID=3127658 RepID=UPI00310BCA66
MVWTDTMGSLGNVQGPAVREAERKEKDKQRKAMERSNAKDIAELDSYIHHITSLHHETIAGIDWPAVARRPAPEAPEVDLSRSERIRTQLAHHEPGFVQWLLGRGRQTRDALDRALHVARQLGHREILATLTPYQQSFEQWELEQAAVYGVHNKDDAAILSVIRGHQTLTRQHKLARGLGISVFEGQIQAVLSVHDQSIVPDFQFKFTPSGKLTEVKMPRERHMAIYRAYVGSAALKVASDLFRTIPVKELVVTCIAPFMDAGTDVEDELPVLSVEFDRDRMMMLDMARTDPVAGLKLFKVAEAFHPVQGFARIVPIVDIPVRMAI